MIEAKKGYTLDMLREDYPDEDTCLNALFQARFGDDFKCPKCKRETKFYKLRTRKSFSCMLCGRHVSPTAGTIFEKSETPLMKWFYVIYMFSVSKHGVAAKEVERHLGCTYKTAWRMCKQIRTAMHIEIPDDDQQDRLRKQFLTSVEGTHHNISAKYFQFYLAEFMFRYQYRKENITPILLKRVMEHKGG